MSEPRKFRIDSVSICNATYLQSQHAESIINRANFISNDADRKDRIEASMCVMCYEPYGAGRVGGAMCCSQECALCTDVMNFGSTCVDKLCLECARKNGLCKHCGADVDLKQRRKKRPFQEESDEIPSLP